MLTDRSKPLSSPSGSDRISVRSASLAYEEPDILTILIQSSFLILLNAIDHVADKLLYCGLLGQIAIGVAWGTPGGNLIGESSQHFITQIGYLGLLLLVFEGGLSTSLPALKANLSLSVAVALTGIALPIAAAFVLIPLLSPSATPIEAFAAGAALCSTSLGTTFTVLGTTGLISARLGVVLSAAAMLDDVVGLVMVQVISSLGQGDVAPVTIIQPLFVAVAFAVGAIVVSRCMMGPILKKAVTGLAGKQTRFAMLIRHEKVKLATCLLVLIALVTGATYAGTSNLFAAYIAGASLTWLDSVASEASKAQPALRAATGDTTSHSTSPPSIDGPTEVHSMKMPTSAELHEQYVKPAVAKVLQPFFFASIGFSIPITQMFDAGVVWRGIIFTLLMTISKLACGGWMLQSSTSKLPTLLQKGSGKRQAPPSAETQNSKPSEHTQVASQRASSSTPDTGAPSAGSTPQANTSAKRGSNASNAHTEKSDPPISLYPAMILGSAMVARGEIGFLISSIGRSAGVLSQESFLVTTWAIVLCTIIGPVTVGLLVNRLKKLESGKEGTRNVLGV